MNPEPEISDKELREMRQIIGLLEKSFRIARDASMTGSMQGGKEYILEQYNSIVKNLTERRTLAAGFFPPLSADASYDAVGVACGQLAEYLKAGLPEERERERRHGRNVNIIGNVGDLKEIGELIRESLPEWMRAAREKREAREAREPREPREPREQREHREHRRERVEERVNIAWAGAPEPIVAPPSHLESELSGLKTSPPEPSAEESAAADSEQRRAELSGRIQDIAEEMRHPGLEPEELQRLAGELSRLAQEQARMG
jgi:hypothetical protein